MIRHGEPPYLDCTSFGEKRLSLYFATIDARDGRSIADLYHSAKQLANGDTGLPWEEMRWLKAANVEEITRLFSVLWQEYMFEHPELVLLIRSVPGLSDSYGTPGEVCSATELWRIRNGEKALATNVA